MYEESVNDNDDQKQYESGLSTIDVTYDETLSTIQSNNNDLETESILINNYTLQCFELKSSLNATKMNLYHKIGNLLNAHRQKVEAANINWTQWASEKFPNLKKRRREQIMKLALYGTSVEQFYFLGFDRLYYLFSMFETYVNKPNELKDMLNELELKLKRSDDLDEGDLKLYKIKIDQLLEYNKLKPIVSKNSEVEQAVVDLIKSNNQFKESDIQALKNLPNENKLDYINDCILTGSSDGANAAQSNENAITKRNIPIKKLIIDLLNRLDETENTVIDEEDYESLEELNNKITEILNNK
jgi:hypothetical protein